MGLKEFRTFVGDFETTSYDGQEFTEVWASALVELYTEEVAIVGSLKDQFKNFLQMKGNLVIYYHNLKFDGQFWIPFLMQEAKLKQALDSNRNFLPNKKMLNNTFKFMQSASGLWYSITIKINGRFIEIRDSYKLLPYSLARIGESFGTKHKKLELEYKGFRYANCPRTAEEDKYIANDVLVIKEALEIMFEQGHDSLTIGSCCLQEYKKTVCDDWEILFPNIYEHFLEKDKYGSTNLGEYIRKSYRGGWCYVKKDRARKIIKGGLTIDVNSLYPSVMHSMSGNIYPRGKGYMWTGNFIPQDAQKHNTLYFVRFTCRFKLKQDKLPFIQIKGNWLYNGREMLETSDIKLKDGSHSRYYIDTEGKKQDSVVTLTMTCVDFELMKEHYHIYDLQILDGVWFYAELGLFDEYINHYAEIKQNSEGAIRESAKLFLNNLYGKMASTTDSSYKIAYEKENGIIGYETIKENNKTGGYIPVGSFITSYARKFTITACQENYEYFCYSDTDSGHFNCEPTQIKGVKFHDTDFCAWKLECIWNIATFTRPKTYIEHITHISKKGDLIPVTPHYDVKCAGMGTKSKQLFLMSLTGEKQYKDSKGKVLLDYNNLLPIEKEFIDKGNTLLDFKEGLFIPTGDLTPKRIKGGIILLDKEYTMH